MKLASFFYYEIASKIHEFSPLEIVAILKFGTIESFSV